MQYPLVIILRALAATFSPVEAQVPDYFKSDACGGIEIPETAACELFKGDSCQNECFAQNFDAACIDECGLQDCHSYDCFEWQCVAYCTSSQRDTCLNGCSAEGALFCDSGYIASGQDAATCVDYLCSKEMTVEGASCK